MWTGLIHDAFDSFSRMQMKHMLPPGLLNSLLLAISLLLKKFEAVTKLIKHEAKATKQTPWLQLNPVNPGGHMQR